MSSSHVYICRPRIPLALATSFSEGEVPHSPGDARWYSIYAARMNKDGLADWKGKAKSRMDPTMETFLDLKNTLDPSCSDSSHLSEDPQELKVWCARLCTEY